MLKKWGAMMSKNCWDCIHCDVCANIDGFSHHVSDVSKCKRFKDKADVEPVKHGKWYWEYDVVLDDYDYHCCSCGKNFAVKEKLTQLPNYCPNCGAKMDGKEVQE